MLGNASSVNSTRHSLYPFNFGWIKYLQEILCVGGGIAGDSAKIVTSKRPKKRRGKNLGNIAHNDLLADNAFSSQIGRGPMSRYFLCEHVALSCRNACLTLS